MAGATSASLPRTVLELAPGPGNSRNSEGDFAQLSDGRILYAYSRFVAGSGADDDRCVIAARTSSDKGESWSEDSIVAVNDFEPKGNVMSVSFLRLKDGRLALFYMTKIAARDGGTHSRTMMKHSSDEGATWSAAREISAAFPRAYRVTNNARVLRTSAGRVLVPMAEHGRNAGDGSLEQNATLYCACSDDDCATWRLAAAVPQATNENGLVVCQEPGLFETKDGRVVMYFRTKEGRQWWAVSGDGGETWGVPAPSPLWAPLAPATIRRLSSGDLVCLWNDHEQPENRRKGNARTPLTLGLSADDGMSWPRRRDLEAGYDPGRDSRYMYCYSSLLELDDRLLVAYCAEDNLRHSRIKSVPLSWLRPVSDEEAKSEK